MSAFGAFLLAVAAFIGTVMLITDPTQKMMKWMRGKRKGEVEAEAKAWVEEQEAGKVIGKGCGFLFFILLALLYTYVVEPVAVISALVNKIGYQPVAYVMLAIVAVSWVSSARAFMKGKSSTETQVEGVVVTEAGQQVKGTVIETDEKIELPHPLWLRARRVFFALPTLYLWYLFLVAIGVLS
jgi:hypothetical protein